MQKIIDFYGKENQIEKTIEELLELALVLKQGINKDPQRLRVALNDLASEIADVEIMLEQLKMIFEFENRINVWRRKKIQRTIEQIKIL